MAQMESDREDLLAEARNLVERVELRVKGFKEPIVAGFRRTGALSFYFGADPVFQFNPMQQWRRGYCDGRLLKAERGRIVQLTRQRDDERVNLVRHDLDQAATAAFMESMQQKLTALQTALEQNRFEIVGQVPENADVVGRIRRWFDQLPMPIVVARRPNA